MKQCFNWARNVCIGKTDPKIFLHIDHILLFSENSSCLLQSLLCVVCWPLRSRRRCQSTWPSPSLLLLVTTLGLRRGEQQPMKNSTSRLNSTSFTLSLTYYKAALIAQDSCSGHSLQNPCDLFCLQELWCWGRLHQNAWSWCVHLHQTRWSSRRGWMVINRYQESLLSIRLLLEHKYVL